eukprot:TRINITY_DN4185_c0_g3_i2.p3 TRINITY_DN4185_c0_g3~~TRINITY_DN4185_c0_g3_i2.p3  ORF type:complete len:104 (+),score=8.01 TRINITY_DN4185_c0_g3_i2:45-356(+)
MMLLMTSYYESYFSTFSTAYDDAEGIVWGKYASPQTFVCQDKLVVSEVNQLFLVVRCKISWFYFSILYYASVCLWFQSLNIQQLPVLAVSDGRRWLGQNPPWM